MGDIKVKSFRASWSNWDINWRRGGKSTIRLPVKFRLELEPGSSKNDCMVGQKRRGKMSDASGIDKKPDWELDGGYWWTGDKMLPMGFGEWDSTGLVATFRDEPGFNKAEGALYLGDMSGTGYFEFQTVVVTRSVNVLTEISWAMRIVVPNPGNGGFWWSYSNQK